MTITVNGSGEYEVVDRHWLLSMYTFAYQGSIDEVELETRMRRRLLFLKKKFFDDLEAGEKTLVLTIDRFDRDLIERLRLALAAIGPSKLLLVATAGLPNAPEGEVGDVVCLGDKHFIGFLGQLGKIAGVWDIQFEQWIKLLQRFEATEYA